MRMNMNKNYSKSTSQILYIIKAEIISIVLDGEKEFHQTNILIIFKKQ